MLLQNLLPKLWKETTFYHLYDSCSFLQIEASKSSSCTSSRPRAAPSPIFAREVLNGLGKCWLLCQRLRQVSVFRLSYHPVKHPQNIGRESFGSHLGVYTSADISSIGKNSVAHPSKCRHFSIGHIFCDTPARVFCGFTGPRSHALCFNAVCRICFYTCTVRGRAQLSRWSGAIQKRGDVKRPAFE